MPVWPQYMNANHVEFSNIIAVNNAQLQAVYQANNGDMLVCSPSATGGKVKLPPVGLGGPVKVLNMATATDTITVESNEASGVDINGVAGSTGVTVAVGAAGVPTVMTFVSDGSNWYSA